MKGTYLLVIEINQTSSIEIGALKTIRFPKGFFIYVGSAMGQRGSTTLVNRVKRHIKPITQKKFHWHIDYFLANEKTVIKKIILLPASEKYECNLAKALIKTADGNIRDFGSSDCNCESHLIYFKNIDKILNKLV
ncbi:MAG: hypothetical protein BAJALOKI2v1_20003 [Promethearchaeota archaeon]|nr:MAG: hypothetical protein BAJALOKI2v1_20003 [Candidatus Lokiarchaeota archaeon]